MKGESLYFNHEQISLLLDALKTHQKVALDVDTQTVIYECEIKLTHKLDAIKKRYYWFPWKEKPSGPPGEITQR